MLGERDPRRSVCKSTHHLPLTLNEISDIKNERHLLVQELLLYWTKLVKCKTNTTNKEGDREGEPKIETITD
jgi:hypothetical protein